MNDNLGWIIMVIVLALMDFLVGMKRIHIKENFSYRGLILRLLIKVSNYLLIFISAQTLPEHNFIANVLPLFPVVRESISVLEHTTSLEKE